MCWDVLATPLAELLRSWKGYTAREANKLLGDGYGVEREYWDTRIRDEEHLQGAALRRDNPVKARLVAEARKWPWAAPVSAMNGAPFSKTAKMNESIRRCEMTFSNAIDGADAGREFRSRKPFWKTALRSAGVHAGLGQTNVTDGAK